MDLVGGLLEQHARQALGVTPADVGVIATYRKQARICGCRSRGAERCGVFAGNKPDVVLSLCGGGGGGGGRRLCCRSHRHGEAPVMLRGRDGANTPQLGCPGAPDQPLPAAHEQVQKLRLLFRTRGLGAIRVGTVDDFQGQVSSPTISEE